jgi:hypothetical protein
MMGRSWNPSGSRKTMFTEDSTLLVGEPVQPTWVVDSGATHHLTAPRELLRHVRKLEEPKVFGLADRTASMNANEVGEVHVPLRSARQVTLKKMYHIPDSRVNVLSLSRLLKHHWTVEMRDDPTRQGTTYLTEGRTVVDGSG